MRYKHTWSWASFDKSAGVSLSGSNATDGHGCSRRKMLRKTAMLDTEQAPLLTMKCSQPRCCAHDYGQDQASISRRIVLVERGSRCIVHDDVGRTRGCATKVSALANLRPFSATSLFERNKQPPLYHQLHHVVPDTLNERIARSAPVNTAPDTANKPRAPRYTTPSPQTTLHLHTAHHALRRQLLYPAHHKSPARLQDHKGYTKFTPMESKLAEAVERRGRRGRKASCFPSKVWQRMGCRC